MKSESPVSIPGFFRRAFIYIFLGTFVLVSLIYIFSEFKQFERSRNERIQNLFAQEKELLRYRVANEIDYLNYRRETKEEFLNEELAFAVESAHLIAKKIWADNHNKVSDRVLREMILSALSEFRAPGKRGKIFINTLDGKSVMSPQSDMQKGTDLRELNDSLGNLVVHRELELLKVYDSGFLEYPDDNHKVQKIAYITRFEEMGWYLGHKIYPEDFVKELQEELVYKIVHQWDGSGDVLFINQFDGTPIVMDGLPYRGDFNFLTNGNEEKRRIFEKEIHVAQEGNKDHFFQCTWDNTIQGTRENIMVYVRSIPEWNWIVGGVFNVDNVLRDVSKQEDLLQAEFRRTFGFSMLFLAVAFLLMFLLIVYYFRNFQEDIRRFVDYFQDPGGGYIEENKLHYPETKTLATSANSLRWARYQIEKDLLSNQKALQNIFDEAPVAMVVVAENCSVQKVNEAFERMFGFPSEILMHNPLYKFIYGNDSQKISCSGDHEVIHHKETFCYRADGSELLVEVTTTSIKDSNSQSNALYIYRDVTDERSREAFLRSAVQKAEDADRLKSAFLANMSHEIRTPMNAIMGFSELLAEDDLSKEEQATYINYIRNNGETLLLLINDIIDFSKIEAGQLKVNKKPFLVNKGMEDLVKIFSRKNGNKLQVDFQTHLADDFMLNADLVRVRQVLTNLLSNAFKFTTQGTIHVTFYKENGSVYFSVKDSGIGVKTEDLDLIFERFRQVETTYQRNYGGAGLGLSISKGLIKLMGGEIGVQSVFGQGSNFYFSIPVANPN